MKYEMLYIIDKDLTDEAKEVVVDKVKKIIESKNGNILTLDKWGMKKFAYPINYKNEGYYVLVNFEASEDVPNVLNAQMNILDGVDRHMCIAKNK